MNQPMPGQQMKAEDPRKKIIWTVVIVIIILIAMGTTAWYFFLGPGKSKTVSQSSGNTTSNQYQYQTTKPSGSEEIAFEVLAAGSISTDTKLEAKNYSFKSNQEFKDLWDEIYSLGGQAKALPSVDFNTSMVLAVVANQASTGGFEMEITKIVESQTALEVTVKEASVAGGCPAEAVMNQPFEFIKIQKTDKEIKFTPQKETKNC